jgi:hypothetical protein
MDSHVESTHRVWRGSVGLLDFHESEVTPFCCLGSNILSVGRREDASLLRNHKNTWIPDVNRLDLVGGLESRVFLEKRLP